MEWTNHPVAILFCMFLYHSWSQTKQTGINSPHARSASSCTLRPLSLSLSEAEFKGVLYSDLKGEWDVASGLEIGMEGWAICLVELLASFCPGVGG